MALTLADVVEKILRDCAESVRPWQPEEFQRPEELSLAQVHNLTDQLVKARLLEPDPHEPGYRATTSARLLLNDDKELRRFRSDLTENSRQARSAWELPANASPAHRLVYDTLHQPIKPLVSRAILALNIAVFLLGLLLALGRGVAGEYLMANDNTEVGNILRQIGALSLPFPPLDNGGRLAWVELLTCCFVHIGVLHIAMNMYALTILGKDIEWLWGRWRFVVIYLIAGLSGSALAVYVQTAKEFPESRPVAYLLAGASGAICGLLAAEGVWLFVNRNFLPKEMVSRQMRALGFNALLIVAISLFANVSGAGHFGGAVGGAVAALLLHLHRFGQAPVKWGYVAALALLPLLIVWPLQPWSPDAPAYRMDLRIPDREAWKLAYGRDKDEAGLLRVLRQAPHKRDPAAVERLNQQLPGVIALLDQAARQLDRPEGAPAGVSEEDRAAARAYFQERAQLFTQMQSTLREKQPWAEAQQIEFLRSDSRRPKWLVPKKDE